MKRLICAATAFALVLSSGIVSAADVVEHQWVRVSEIGTVQGRVVVPRNEGISAARGAKVSLIDHYGKYVGAGTESDKTGRFTLANVTPGVYTLMIQGENAFACCAMHVVSSEVPISDHFEIAAGAVDYNVVQDAMVRYLPPGQATEVVFDPTSNPMVTDRALLGESVRVTQFEGGLKGRLTRAGFTDDLGAKNSNVLIYHDGVEVARTITDELGNFEVAELPPGSYSVLGSGKDGFGLMGFELINPSTIQSAQVDSADGTTLVVQTDEVADTFIMQVAPGPITVIEDRLIDERDLGPAIPLDGTGFAYDPAPMGGSFGGGGGGGGAGGGIGGGGRLGNLAIIGGFTALAIALSDDDDIITPPPVISPAAPAVPTP